MIEWITEIPAPILVAIGATVGLALLSLTLYFRDQMTVAEPIALATTGLMATVGIPVSALIAGFTLGQILSVLLMAFFAVGLGAVALFAVFWILFILGTVFIPVR